MKRCYFRNNETDFYKWRHTHVSRALYKLKRFEDKSNGLDLILFWDEYYDALETSRQYSVIKAALSIDYQLFLDDCLIKQKKASPTAMIRSLLPKKYITLGRRYVFLKANQR